MRGIPFTDTEKRVLHCYVRGDDPWKIAERMGIKESSVNTYLKHIRYKTGTCKIITAYRKALRLGWVKF